MKHIWRHDVLRTDNCTSWRYIRDEGESRYFVATLTHRPAGWEVYTHSHQGSIPQYADEVIGMFDTLEAAKLAVELLL